MSTRRRASGLGGAALAAVAVTLFAAPAASASETDGSAEPDAPVVTHRQVGMQVGSLPVQVTASFEVPGWLLPAAPENLVTVPGIHGEDLLRLNATRVYTKTDAPNFGGSIPVLTPGGHEVGTTSSGTAGQTRAPQAQAPHVAAGPAAVAAPSALPAVLDTVEIPAQADANAQAFGWVPIGQLSGSMGSSSDLNPVTGLALVALAGGAAAVVVVRRRFPAAG